MRVPLKGQTEKCQRGLSGGRRRSRRAARAGAVATESNGFLPHTRLHQAEHEQAPRTLTDGRDGHVQGDGGPLDERPPGGTRTVGGRLLQRDAARRCAMARPGAVPAQQQDCVNAMARQWREETSNRNSVTRGSAPHFRMEVQTAGTYARDAGRTVFRYSGRFSLTRWEGRERGFRKHLTRRNASPRNNGSRATSEARGRQQIASPLDADRGRTERELTERELTERELTERELTERELTERELTERELTER